MRWQSGPKQQVFIPPEIFPICESNLPVVTSQTLASFPQVVTSVPSELNSASGNEGPLPNLNKSRPLASQIRTCSLGENVSSRQPLKLKWIATTESAYLVGPDR